MEEIDQIIPIYQSSKNKLMEMFENKKFIKCVAPMVRYSKQPFRLFCRKWGCDVAYTPMIVAEDFVLSKKSRDNEFTTNDEDRPLIVQFAAKDPSVLANASIYVSKHCEAIDINCGCPQKWVMKDGYGSALLEDPELIRNMVNESRNASGIPCSVKIRVDKDMKKTIDLVKKVEKAGVSFIGVHGRTFEESSGVPARWDEIKLVKENVNVPVIANGDIFSLKDALKCKEITNCDGVMSARGILSNPAMYLGYDKVPNECISDFLKISVDYGLAFKFVHFYLMSMLFSIHTNPEKQIFNRLTTNEAIIQYFRERNFDI